MSVQEVSRGSDALKTRHRNFTHPQDLAWLTLSAAALILLGYTIDNHIILATAKPAASLNDFPGIIPENIHWATVILTLFLVPTLCAVASFWLFSRIPSAVTLLFLSIPVAASLLIELFWIITTEITRTNMWAITHLLLPSFVTILSDIALVMLLVLSVFLALHSNIQRESLQQHSDPVSTDQTGKYTEAHGKKTPALAHPLAGVMSIALLLELYSLARNFPAIVSTAPTVANSFAGQTITLGWIGIPLLLAMTLIAAHTDVHKTALGCVLLVFYASAIVTFLVRSNTLTSPFTWWRLTLLIIAGAEVFLLCTFTVIHSRKTQ